MHITLCIEQYSLVLRLAARMGNTWKDEAVGPEDLKELGRTQASLNPILLSPWESSLRGRGGGQGR